LTQWDVKKDIAENNNFKDFEVDNQCCLEGRGKQRTKNNGPENKSLLNKVVLNKLKQHKDNKKINNPIKRYKASVGTKYLETIVFSKTTN
jgi:hypothetical protein